MPSGSASSSVNSKWRRQPMSREKRMEPPRLSLVPSRPVQRIPKDHEADACISRGLGENGEPTGHVRVKRAGGSRLRRIVNSQADPESIRVIAHAECMPHKGKHEQADGAQGENCRHGVRRVLVVRVDCPFRSDDRGNTADG